MSIDWEGIFGEDAYEQCCEDMEWMADYGRVNKPYPDEYDCRSYDKKHHLWLRNDESIFYCKCPFCGGVIIESTYPEPNLRCASCLMDYHYTIAGIALTDEEIYLLIEEWGDGIHFTYKDRSYRIVSECSSFYLGWKIINDKGEECDEDEFDESDTEISEEPAENTYRFSGYCLPPLPQQYKYPLSQQYDPPFPENTASESDDFLEVIDADESLPF